MLSILVNKKSVRMYRKYAGIGLLRFRQGLTAAAPAFGTGSFWKDSVYSQMLYMSKIVINRKEIMI